MLSKQRKNWIKILGFALVLTMLLQIPFSAAAEGAVAAPNSTSVSVAIGGSTDYADYYESIKKHPFAESMITLSGADAVFTNGTDGTVMPQYKGKKEVLYWKDGNGTVSWRFNVPKTALYQIAVSYQIPESSADLNIALRLDGALPFEQCDEISLTLFWQDKTDRFKTDNAGNQLVPEQTAIREFATKRLSDHAGEYTEPFVLLLTAGSHTLSLSEPQQSVALEKVELLPPENAKPYAETVAGAQIAAGSDEIIFLQGESADVKSTNALIAKSETENADMTPADPTVIQLNYIGGTAWQTPGEELVWNFDVPADGYYAITYRYKQSEVVNGETHRWLRIDGETPFKEAEDIAFAYHTGWELYTFGKNEEEPYYIKLNKGTHQLSLTVTLGSLAEYQRRLNKIVGIISDAYINIIKITGSNPDVNRDYELFKQIPELEEQLNGAYNDLEQLARDMRAFSGKRNNQYIAAMENMMRVLNSMLKNPYTAQYYIKDYYSNYSSLSSWLFEMKQMPLSIDEIQLVPAGAEPERNKTGLWKSISFTFRRLVYSFTKDYTNAVNEDENGTTLTLWTSWGRDQASALNSLIQSSFTASTGIKVRVQQVNCSLINGLLSGNYPDMLLQMNRTEPLNLGMRGALYDLSQFPDYEEVLKRFQTGADVPYWYRNQLFALPDTQSFFIMFYRSDILQSLGLSVPETWDEFINMTTVIRRNHLDVFIPYTQITDSTTVNGGIGSLSLFPTLLAQNGLSLYNEKRDATLLDNDSVIDVFEQWTDLYTKNLYLKAADFYNRFRTGTMPLGIAPYSTYMTLHSAAPEIQGKWSMAPIPGTKSGSAVVTGGGTGCGIVKRTAHPNEAWEFLKWWTSADTQVRFSQNTESLLGLLGRPAISNVEAFKQLSWESGAEEVLLEQWSRVVETPEVPGSYYVSRAVDQAFWAVTNGKSNARDASLKWSAIANEEIRQKISEYSK